MTATTGGGPAREVVECPHCGEPTLPNPLPDGSAVCSCAAERPLPATPPRPPLRVVRRA